MKPHEWVNKDGEVLVLRFSNQDGTSYGWFQHPMKIGEAVTIPDWNPANKCGGGIHGWPLGLGIGDGKDADWTALWQVYGVKPVFGLVERNGRAKTFHVERVNRANVMDKIQDNVSIQADAVYTDESTLYIRMPENVQKHRIVNHRAKEWVRGDVHTGTIDGYWGLLKRGIIGSFHQVSAKHLHRYLSEFQFRWNNRESQDIFALVVAALVIGIGMTYTDLIKNSDADAF